MNENLGDSLLNSNPLQQPVTEDIDIFELWGVMANTEYAISKSRFVEIGKIGLTPQKAQVLQIIEDNGGSILQNEISGITMRRQNSVSNLVNRMIKEGLIVKKRLPNGRKYLLIIGKKGREKRNKLTRQSIEMIFSVLMPQDYQVMNLILNKLLDKSSSLLGLDINIISPGKEGQKTSKFDLWGVLAWTTRAISRSRFLEIGDVGLTPEKARILHIIQIHGGFVPQNKISDITMRRQHSVSDLINRMVREGLIFKTKRSVDRVYMVKMSKKGKEKYHKLKRNTLNEIFSVLTPEDRRNLHMILNKLLGKSRNLLGLDYTTPF